MSEISEGLKIIVAVLSLAQILLGCGAWYIGLQIKMLRLELVPRELCDERHDRLTEDLGKIHASLAVAQEKLAQDTSYCKRA